MCECPERCDVGVKTGWTRSGRRLRFGTVTTLLDPKERGRDQVNRSPLVTTLKWVQVLLQQKTSFNNCNCSS